MPDSASRNEFTVQGIAASQGIAYGQIFLYLQNEVQVPDYQVEVEKRIDEVARFDRALVLTRQQVARTKSEVERNIGPEEAAIFDAHLMVLEDEALIGETIREFENTGRNIETCFHRVSSRYVQAFSEIDDEYLRERAGDLRDVTQRVLRNLLGQEESSLNKLADQRIVVAAGVLEDPFSGASLSLRIPNLITRFVQRHRSRQKRTMSFEAIDHSMTVHAALRLLHLSTVADRPYSLKDIREAYREQAQCHHPDAGGSQDAMRRLNEAYQFLKERYRRAA